MSPNLYHGIRYKYRIPPSAALNPVVTTEMHMMTGKLLGDAPLVDVLVIGGGPSGLSTATGLARQLHSVIVFDSGVYRNTRATHMHNVLGWDHRNPAELRAAGRAQLMERYTTVTFEDSTIESVRMLKEQRLFVACNEVGKKWYGRKVVLAIGVRDIPLDIEGYDQCWANGIYHCLFCDGYEDRGQATVGILGVELVANVQRAVHLALMAHQLSQSVTIYTNGNTALVDEIKSAVSDAPWLKVDTRPITKFEKGDTGKTVILHFDDAKTKQEGFLIYNPKTEINGPFANQLSLALTEAGDIQTSQPFHETSVPGVFAVGDCATPLKIVTPAMSMGSLTAAGLVAQLQAQSMVEVVDRSALSVDS